MKHMLYILIAFFILSCADNNSKLKEEVRFLLDSRQYELAIEKARQAVDKDPDDYEANFLLASALIGDSVLSGSSNCPPQDDGVLGLLACLSDPLAPNESELGSFLRIAPDLEKIENLEEGTDILVALEATGLATADEENVFIRVYAARLFEIAGALTRVGLKTENNECNHCINSTPGCELSMKDHVPDGFDAYALTPAQEDRFRENLQEVNEVGGKLGLSQDFSLILRADEIGLQLGLDNIPIFFESTFNSVDQATCDEPL